MHATLTPKSNDYILVIGHLNFATVPRLLKQGEQFLLRSSTLTFDLKDVSYTDSSGLALLIAWLKQARQLNKVICFVNLSQQLADVAKVSGVGELFNE